MSEPIVLIVEDDPALRDALAATVELAGFAVKSASDGTQAMQVLENQPVQLVVSDVQMDGMDGYTLLQKVKANIPQLPVVLMTAYGTIQKAVEAMRAGAADYLVKPFDAEALVEMLRNYLPDVGDDPEVVAEDPGTRKLATLARRVAGTDATVMISGEAGTGKEVFAQMIHRHSTRKQGPFVAINCAAIPENMLEASLFGYEKGAFSGASSRNGCGSKVTTTEVPSSSLALLTTLRKISR